MRELLKCWGGEKMCDVCWSCKCNNLCWRKCVSHYKHGTYHLLSVKQTVGKELASPDCCSTLTLKTESLLSFPNKWFVKQQISLKPYPYTSSALHNTLLQQHIKTKHTNIILCPVHRWKLKVSVLCRWKLSHWLNRGTCYLASYISSTNYYASSVKVTHPVPMLYALKGSCVSDDQKTFRQHRAHMCAFSYRFLKHHVKWNTTLFLVIIETCLKIYNVMENVWHANSVSRKCMCCTSQTMPCAADFTKLCNEPRTCILMST